jgi:hypothetical protein
MPLKNFKYLFVYLIIGIGVLTSCDDIRNSASAKKNSQGAYGEVMVIMDTLQWEGKLGESIRKVFQKAFPALPQGEAYFNLRYIRPHNFAGLLKNHSTLIYVTTFDNKSKGNQKIQSYFSEDSKKKILNESDNFLYTRKDEFAKNQLVLHLFGSTEEELINNLYKNEIMLSELIDISERKRIHIDLYRGKEEKELTNYFREEYNFGFRIPFGYDLAIEQKNFYWFSQLGNDLFRNLIVSTRPYESEQDFSRESIVNWRNEIGKTYLFGSGEKDTVSYMLTDEKYVPVIQDTVDFNGKYAIETRGLWKLKNNTRGGPFLSYVFVDRSRKTMYYVEAFLYAPNKIKRHIMRELEAVLYSFRTPEELKK